MHIVKRRNGNGKRNGRLCCSICIISNLHGNHSMCVLLDGGETEMETVILILKILLKIVGYSGYALCMWVLLGKRNGLKLAIYITVFVMMVIVSIRI